MTDSSKSILIFDTEATGKDTEKDQIIEISVQEGLSEDSPHQTWRIRPDIPITPEAQEVHGISDIDLKSCPKFNELVSELNAVFDRAEIVIGYNVDFDISLVVNEYNRCGETAPDFSQKTVIDPYVLWRKMEPRRLVDACKRFTGKELDDAHEARADVVATGNVLTGMLKAFKLEDNSWDDIAKLSATSRSNWVGPSRHVQFRDGAVVLSFGKHAGKPLVDLATSNDKSYLQWIIKQDFPAHVKAIANEALSQSSDGFYSWVKGEFGVGE